MALLEVETKIKVGDHALLKRRLGELGAVFRAAVTQRDRYYCSPLRDFAQTDEALRLRIENGSATVTYKGPKRPSPVGKARKEVSVAISSGEEFEEILTYLGFLPVAEVKKRREEFEWRGAEISLDTVEDLGQFVEIEVLCEDGQEQAEKVIDSIKDALRLSGPHIPESYLELILARQKGARS
ncbi:MAG: class IV adenylate cyclase [Methanomicrobiaceae archaeon]|nr:class IV adenylate cyclase [Methanomicrobiaceae archaeon]